MFEVIQSYSPLTSTLSFSVPVHPDALLGTDHFDTFAGTLDNLDFGQLQALQCNFPTPIPAPGDVLQVADTLPVPPLGEGFFYVVRRDDSLGNAHGTYDPAICLPDVGSFGGPRRPTSGDCD